jgi:hypothetical protein
MPTYGDKKDIKDDKPKDSILTYYINQNSYKMPVYDPETNYSFNPYNQNTNNTYVPSSSSASFSSFSSSSPIFCSK